MNDTIQPLLIPVEPADCSSSNWNCLESWVVPHPQDETLSLEVCWECSHDDERHRIVVYSGPDSNQNLLVSLRLPDDAVYSSNTTNSVVLTKLLDHHSVLCVLVHCSMLLLFDIFPDPSSKLKLPLDGWNVPLPFDCAGLFAGNNCLILQRLEDEADVILPDEPTMMIPSPPFCGPPKASDGGGVSSLFSLHHPLQDVLPISTPNGSPITDVFETILWSNELYVVTYHTQHRRHGIWKVTAASCSVPPLPLYERTKQAYGWLNDTQNYRHNVSETDIDYLLLDDEDPASSRPSTGNTFSRQDALADALGVRRTPRKSLSNNTPFQQQHAAAATTPGLSHSTTPLFAKIALRNIFFFDNQSSRHSARRVFVASDMKNSTLLCLLMEHALIVLRLDDKKQLVEIVGEIACRDAQPIATSQHHTDLLILHANGQLGLFRGTVPLVDCNIFHDGNFATATGLQTAVHNRFGLQLGKSPDYINARAQLTLTVENASPFAEAVLSVLDAAVQPLLAAQIRIDSLRLFRSLSQSADSYGGVEDVAFVAVQTVITEIFRAALGIQGPSIQQQSPNVEALSSFERLMQSEYHELYLKENKDSFLPTCRMDFRDRSFRIQSENTLSNIGSLVINAGGTGEKNWRCSDVFDALVFSYEESKLRVSDGPRWTSRLGAVLVELCGWYLCAYPAKASITEPFLTHFRNDMGDSSFQAIARAIKSEPAADVAADCKLSSFQFPPSIFAWIDSMLRQHDHDHTYGGLTEMEQINAACTKTRSVLRLLMTLIGNNREPNRDLAVVQALIEEGYTDSSSILEDLPPGVALPILEVLHRCRNSSALSEAEGWDTAAWAIVGRQDLCRNSVDSTVSLLDFAEPTGLSPEIEAPLGGEKSAEVEDAKDGLRQVERSAAVFFPQDNRAHEAARLLRSSRPNFLRVPRAIELSDHDYERLKQKRLLLLSYRSLALPVGRGMLMIGNLNPVPADPLPLPDLCLKGRVPPTNATLNLDTSECPPDMKVWPEFHNGVAAGMRLPVAGADLDGFVATRSWILFNRPPFNEPPETQESSDDANQQTPAANYSHGGVLLALGLRGHLKALELSDVYNYLTQGNVTTTIGVLLGLAANYRGTCDIAVSKTICLHIPSVIPQHFSAIDVASTVQTAGVASAGILYQGSSHRMFTEFLLNEIGKRPESDVNTSDREAYTLACGLALGTVNLCIGKQSDSSHRRTGIADLHIEDRLIRYVIGGIDPEESARTKEANDRFTLRSSEAGNDNEKCSVVYEGELVNTDVTAPGSILALGFMYLKTENSTMADALALPDTHFLLEFVRPDFLGLRVISRAMICWGKVQPTSDWIDDQIPLVVRDAFEQMKSTAKSAFGLRSPAALTQKTVDYDRRAVRQIYAHVVAGACFGMGLRYAGTGNEQAKNALFSRLTELHSLKEASDPVSVALRPELPILDTCLGCVAISLAMVMAGSGDLEVLRLLKIIRWRCDESSKYGMHMIHGMAIGLLFLGGGTCTLGREPEDIAALVTAFFPRFPMVTSDNQYHLQALRHLYGLAVKRRDLRAVDVETGESVSVPVEVTRDDGISPLKLTVPCLLPNSDHPYRQLLVRSDKYYPLTLDLKQTSSNVFFVKKRKSQQSSDPFLLRHVLSKKFCIESLTSDAFLCAYSKHVLDGDSDFATRSLLQCITEDKQEALFVYLALQQQDPINLHLIQAYYQNKKRVLGDDGPTPLLNTESLLPYLQERRTNQPRDFVI